jgi:hypothetical protein
MGTNLGTDTAGDGSALQQSTGTAAPTHLRRSADQRKVRKSLFLLLLISLDAVKWPAGGLRHVRNIFAINFTLRSHI